MEKSIYALELHESTIIRSSGQGSNNDAQFVTRVPGGWIYRTSRTWAGNDSSKAALSESSVFVPFDTEFSDDYNENGEKLGNREKE